MFSKNLLSRRNFFVLAGAAGAGLMEGCSKSSRPVVDYQATAIEILERQHGANRRALAVMHKIKDKINAQMEIPSEITGKAIGIIEAFMIDSHQVMEEKFVFPVLEAAHKTEGLIAVLRRQHAAASKLTEILKPLCANFSQNDQENRRKTANMIHLLTRMACAHESWEDTALFPLLRDVIPAGSYKDLSSELQKAETRSLGLDGFNETMQKIAYCEKSLGIGNLPSFTPAPEDLS